MHPQLLRKTALVWLLAFATAVWGGVVAVHEHLGIDHQQCEICLLPQVGAVAHEATNVARAPVTGEIPAPAAYDYRTPTTAHYQSRAPPR